MEPLLETIDLDVEKSNELFFKIKVEGVDQAPTKVRLVCEAGDVSYMFKGYSTTEDGMIQFVLPALKGQLKEGTYPGRVEVLIENRYFSPLMFNINFKREMSVVVESVAPPQRAVTPQVKVVAMQPPPVKKVVPVASPPAPKPFIVEAEQRPVTVAAPRPKVPVVAPVVKPTTLREHVSTRSIVEEEEVVDVDDLNEDLIRDLARMLVKKR